MLHANRYPVSAFLSKLGIFLICALATVSAQSASTATRAVAPITSDNPPPATGSMSAPLVAPKPDEKTKALAPAPVAPGGVMSAPLLKPAGTSPKDVPSALPPLVSPAVKPTTTQPSNTPLAPPSQVAAPAINKIVLPVTASPSNLDFGEVWSGDSRHKLVSVGVGADGNVSAGIPPGKVFRITKIEVFGLPPTAPVNVIQKSGGPKTGKDEVVTQKLSGMQGPKPEGSKGEALVQKPVTPQQGGQQMPLTQKLLATKSSAPFTLPAKQGDSVRITVDFTPDPNIFSGTPVGKHDSSLAVSGAGWKADVPLSASYNGVKVGMIGLIESRDVNIIIPEAYYPNKSAPLDINVTLINSEKQSQDVTISPSNLPAWLKFTDRKITVPAGKTITVPLSFEIASYNSVPRGKPIAEVSAELNMESNGISKKLPFTLRTMPGSYQWSFSDGGSWQATLTIHSDGRTAFFFACPKAYLGQLSHKCNAAFYFGGNKLGSLIVVGDKEMTSFNLSLSYVAEQYTNMIAGTPSVRAPEWDPKDSKVTNGKAF